MHVVNSGTPLFMSPELCEGREYSDRSDVWALGCVFYEMLTGRHPFDARNHGHLVLKIIRGRYPLPSGISAQARGILEGCLKRDWRGRPSAGGVAEAVERILYGTCGYASSSHRLHLKRWSYIHPYPLISTICNFIFIFLLIFFLFFLCTID